MMVPQWDVALPVLVVHDFLDRGHWPFFVVGMVACLLFVGLGWAAIRRWTRQVEVVLVALLSVALILLLVVDPAEGPVRPASRAVIFLGVLGLGGIALKRLPGWYVVMLVVAYFGTGLIQVVFNRLAVAGAAPWLDISQNAIMAVLLVGGWLLSLRVRPGGDDSTLEEVRPENVPGEPAR